jgi:hypothetical protein
MTSTQPLGTLCSVASLLAATLNQGNHDRNHNHWNIVSTEIDIPYASAVKVATYKWKVHNRKIEHISFYFSCTFHSFGNYSDNYMLLLCR